MYNLDDKKTVKSLTTAFSDKPINPSKVNIYTPEFYKEAQKILYRKSFYDFFKWAFDILEPSVTLVDNFHIKYLCDVLQSEVERIMRGEDKQRDILVNVSPRTSKSLILSVCFPAWVWLKIPNARFICSSFSDDLVSKNARLSKDLIDHAAFKDLFGDIYNLREDRKAISDFGNTRGGVRISKTINSGVTGFDALFTIIDDPQDPKSAASALDRQSVIDSYTQKFYNRCTPLRLGSRIILMQRLAENDLTGYLLHTQPDMWEHINLPALDNGQVKPAKLAQYYQDGYFDPILLGQNQLDGLKITLGGWGFSTQYLQEPINTADGFIKKEWFDDNMIDKADIMGQTVHFFIDPAYTEKTKNDPSALLACYVKDNILYVIDVVAVRKNFPDLIAYINFWVNIGGRYTGQSRIYIEPKASGISLVQQLKNDTKLNVVEAEPPQKDKVARIYEISPKIEAGRVRLLKSGWNEEFINQVCSISEKSLPKHDDMADCLVMAVNKLIKKDRKAWQIFS